MTTPQQQRLDSGQQSLAEILEHIGPYLPKRTIGIEPESGKWELANTHKINSQDRTPAVGEPCLD